MQDLFSVTFQNPPRKLGISAPTGPFSLEVPLPQEHGSGSAQRLAFARHKGASELRSQKTIPVRIVLGDSSSLRMVYRDATALSSRTGCSKVNGINTDYQPSSILSRGFKGSSRGIPPIDGLVFTGSDGDPLHD